MLAYFIHVAEVELLVSAISLISKLTVQQCCLDMCNIEAVVSLVGGISLVPVQFDSIWDVSTRISRNPILFFPLTQYNSGSQISRKKDTKKSRP